MLGSIWWNQLRGVDLPYRNTARRTVGHSHVLPPAWRTDAGAKAVTVRMTHKAAARMRRLGYRAGYLTVQVRHLDAAAWERRLSLGLACDTLTMVRALEPWRSRPRATPTQVGVMLMHLVVDGNSNRGVSPHTLTVLGVRHVHYQTEPAHPPPRAHG